jgi:hypothetical protein
MQVTAEHESHQFGDTRLPAQVPSESLEFVRTVTVDVGR